MILFKAKEGHASGSLTLDKGANGIFNKQAAQTLRVIDVGGEIFADFQISSSDLANLLNEPSIPISPGIASAEIMASNKTIL